MTSSLPSDVISRAQGGDLEAIGELYDIHAQAVFQYFRSRIDDLQLAEDLTGDVFKRMLTGLRYYQPRGLPFRAWLFRIAHNRLVDYFRREGSRESVIVEGDDLEDTDGGDPFESLEKEQLIEQVYQSLKRLNPFQRDILTLRFLSGLSLLEVAQVLGQTENSVKAHQRRGLAALRLVLTRDRLRE